MTKHLLLSATAAANLRLPEDADLDSLSRLLKRAMTTNEVVTIQVAVPGAQQSIAELHINGSTLNTCAVVEFDELLNDDDRNG